MSLLVYAIVVVVSARRRRLASAASTHCGIATSSQFFLIGVRAVRRRARRRVRRPHLPAGARPAALHDPCGAGALTSRRRHCRRPEIAERLDSTSDLRSTAEQSLSHATDAPSSSPITTSARAACASCCAHGVDVPLVRHARRRSRTKRSGSSASPTSPPTTASAIVMPADVNAPEIVARIARSAPDFFFSFYYRQMLKRGAARDPGARRAQHARLAAAEIPRTRAGELGGPARRARNRRDACTTWRTSRTPATSSRRPRCRSCPTTPRATCSPR